MTETIEKKLPVADMNYEQLSAKFLEKKKIQIKPLVRTDGFIVSADKSGATGFDMTKKGFTLPTKSDGNYFDFLTPDEQEAFEKMLNLPKGSLSFYIKDRKKASESYWNPKSFSLQVSPEGVTLDLSKPLDNLKFRLTKVFKDKLIAPSWSERFNRGEYLFVVVDTDVLTADNLTKGDLKKKAWIAYGKIEAENKKMTDVLRLLGKNVAPNQVNNSDFLKSEIMKFIEDEEVGGARKFLDVVDNPMYQTQVLIMDSVVCKALEIKTKKPYTTYGFPGEGKIGDIMETVKFLEDPMNADLKLKLQAQVQAAKNK